MTFTLTLSHVLAAILAVAGGSGTLGAIVALGAFHRWIKPAIRAEITTYEGEAATVEARKHVVRDVIDDQTARSDGVIRRHTREIDDRSGAEFQALRSALGAVTEELAQFRGLLAAFLEHVPDRPTPAPPTPRGPLDPRPPR